MHRFRAAALAAVAALLSSACYRVTVVTGASPTATMVDKPWVNSFVYGLVPPQPIDVSKECAGNVSKVVTQHSFLNGLVAGITWGIYTPIQVTTTCGSGRSSMRLPKELLGTPTPTQTNTQTNTQTSDEQH